MVSTLGVAAADSLLPARTFTDPADVNAQLRSRLEHVAHRRFIRDLQARPAELIGADRAALMPLPLITPRYITGGLSLP